MEKILPLAAGSFGLVSLPPGGRSSVAVVLLNAGLIHRSGPFRLYTRLARKLAKSGYIVLRFDLPGIGDAPMTTAMTHSGTTAAHSRGSRSRSVVFSSCVTSP